MQLPTVGLLLSTASAGFSLRARDSHHFLQLRLLGLGFIERGGANGKRSGQDVLQTVSRYLCTRLTATAP